MHGEKSYFHQEDLRQNDQIIYYGSLRFIISKQTKIFQTNDTPGTPQLSVLSFHGGFHGNLTTNRASLSSSTSTSFTTIKKITTAKMIIASAQVAQQRHSRARTRSRSTSSTCLLLPGPCQTSQGGDPS